jgi:hypothetical protein
MLASMSSSNKPPFAGQGVSGGRSSPDWDSRSRNSQSPASVVAATQSPSRGQPVAGVGRGKCTKCEQGLHESDDEGPVLPPLGVKRISVRATAKTGLLLEIKGPPCSGHKLSDEAPLPAGLAVQRNWFDITGFEAAGEHFLFIDGFGA